ncbi:MAG: glucose-6-phosphate isomerase [Planctomycetaceae bacterium]|nr:glucose-6-phosphate isomerase [Planctomycetaceae bacterium]
MSGKIRPIQYRWNGALIPEYGIKTEDIEGLYPALKKIRDQIFSTELPLYNNQGEVPANWQPLDAGFIELPQRLLNDYQSQREASELGRILSVAKRLRDQVDRVVVLGIGGSYMGARAILESCCQPYYNEWSRAERGGRPRIYFEGNNVDNDHSQALLQFLGNGRPTHSVDDRWALVVISKSGGTIETAVAFRQFLRALEGSLGDEKHRLPEFVIPITGDTGKLASLADALGCQDRFPVPDGVGGRFSIFSAVGLLPAALMGVDVVAMLQGAVAMNERFRTEGLGNNPVLDYTAVSYLTEQRCGLNTRIMSVWSKSLEAVGLWYDQLLAESLGKQEQGALPLTVVNTRDLHSRAQQHQEGRRDKLITNVILDSWRYDPLKVGTSVHDQDGLNELAHKSLPDLMSAAIAGTNQAYFEDSRLTTNLHLPASDESSIGQLLQMLMLATVVEGRLMGINPYGQPGVEKYKINMKRLLK